MIIHIYAVDKKTVGKAFGHNKGISSRPSLQISQQLSPTITDLTIAH
jgi:hypothetical protein